MDFSKIPFSTISIIVGAFLIMLSSGRSIEIGQYHYMLFDSGWERVFLSSSGLLLIGVGIYVEIIRQQKTRKLSSEKQGQKVRTKFCPPERFFYTLDDSESFPAMVQEAVKVRIFSKTAVNLLSQYRKVFEDLGHRGCKLEFLFVDPQSSIAEYLYGNNPQLYRYNIRSAAHHLRKLKESIGHNIEVRATPHSPTFSLVIVEKQNKQESFMQVQLYFLYGAIGRDRPIFRISYGDKWYNTFYKEYERIWNESLSWDIEKFILENDYE